MNIKKGDKVKILSGKDKGKIAEVLKAFPKDSKVLIEGINLIKKHFKAKVAGQKSEIITKPSPIDASNVQVVCSKCGNPSRIGKKDVDGKRVRVCKKCGAEL